MIGKITTPKTKQQLLKAIQNLKNPKIDVLEILDRSEKLILNQHFDKRIASGNFTIIFIQE